MTTNGFVASHLRDARFERGLRSFFEYRDLGIRDATQGRVVAHVIRAAAGNAVRVTGWEEWDLDASGLITLSRGWFDAEDYARQTAPK